MLKVSLIGHLGNDAVVNNVNGKIVINFNVAHSEKWVDNSGVKNEKSVWVSCSYWTDKTNIASYLRKGTQVYVEGNIEAKIYKPQNGEAQAQLTCRVVQVQLLGSANSDKEEKKVELRKTGHYSEVELKSDIPQGGQELPF